IQKPAFAVNVCNQHTQTWMCAVCAKKTHICATKHESKANFYCKCVQLQHESRPPNSLWQRGDFCNGLNILFNFTNLPGDALILPACDCRSALSPSLPSPPQRLLQKMWHLPLWILPPCAPFFSAILLRGIFRHPSSPSPSPSLSSPRGCRLAALFEFRREIGFAEPSVSLSGTSPSPAILVFAKKYEQCISQINRSCTGERKCGGLATFIYEVG
uniref:Uncharacterized protein n=1 Tax=Aegilops tauschii subsp. strangulata TaxID=200361 RepID=A0A453KAC7_AEGTS